MGEKLHSQIEPEVWEQKEEESQITEELFPEAQEDRSSKLVAELFQRAKEGDEDAFDRLVFLYAGVAKSFVEANLDKAQDPNDLIQESYVAIAEVIRRALERGDGKNLNQLVYGHIKESLGNYSEKLVDIPTKRLDALGVVYQENKELIELMEVIQEEINSLRADLAKIERDPVFGRAIRLSKNYETFLPFIKQGSKKEEKLDDLLRQHFANREKVRAEEEKGKLKSIFKVTEAHHLATVSKLKVMAARKDLRDFKDIFLAQYHDFPQSIKFSELDEQLVEYEELIKEIEKKQEELNAIKLKKHYAPSGDYSLAGNKAYKQMDLPPLDIDEVEIPNGESFEEIIHNKDLMDKLLELAKGKLTERELEILRDRYGFSESAKSYVQLAAQFGVTRGRIKQIETNALCKIRRAYIKMHSGEREADSR